MGAARAHQRCCPTTSGCTERVRAKLRLVDMVTMLDNRTVVPLKLRDQVLETLHSAHQGVFSMGLRAEQAVYWPGFWSDIKETRSRCSTCQNMVC